ncbi:hypothetical protein [Sphingomonas sp.]|uniref:hypothetical protein n=1 Tax=Sphingomonas sp. TaxID=28214 RepID=UPI003D6D8109
MLIATLAAVTACDRQTSFSNAPVQRGWEAGWHYTWGNGSPRAYYGFGPPQMVFGGTCQEYPLFLLLGGDYGARVASFTVEIDGKKQEFPAFKGAHERSLLLTPKAADAATDLAMKSLAQRLASARTPIVITTDDGWTRSVPPSPMIARFNQECISWRARQDAQAAAVPSDRSSLPTP